MQNFSILQLLKALSALNGENSPLAPTANVPTPAPQSASPTEEKSTDKSSELKNTPLTHAKEQKNFNHAYENFLQEHERAIKRIQKEK